LLLEATQEQQKKLSHPDKTLLRSKLKSFETRHNGKFKVGSFYTGSGMEFHPIRLLMHIWGMCFGVAIEVTIAFIVEKVEWRRTFCTDEWKPEQAFDNTLDLMNNNWRGHDHISDKDDVPLSPCDMLLGGFECDDRSLLNNHNRESSDNGISEGSGRTGSTAQAIIKFVIARRCRALLENLKVLGAKNLQAMLDQFNEEHFLVVPIVLEAREYGSNVRRERQWFYIEPVPENYQQKVEDLRLPAWAEKLKDIIREQKTGAGNLDEFLLDDADPRLAAWHAKEVEQKNQDAKQAKRKSGEGALSKSAVDHQVAFFDVGLPWPAEIPNTISQALAMYPQSYHEKAVYYTANFSGESLETAHDLNMSLDYGSSAPAGKINCIVCSSVYFLRLRRRLLFGYEALRLQGFPVHLLRTELSQTRGMQLAGNSFNAFKIPALITGIFVHSPSIDVDIAKEPTETQITGEDCNCDDQDEGKNDAEIISDEEADNDSNDVINDDLLGSSASSDDICGSQVFDL
jgi:site-specific DNA-cytosine methylase